MADNRGSNVVALVALTLAAVCLGRSIARHDDDVSALCGPGLDASSTLERKLTAEDADSHSHARVPVRQTEEAQTRA